MNPMWRIWLAVLLAGTVGSCRSAQEAASGRKGVPPKGASTGNASEAQARFEDVFAHVRVDRERGVVEFDGFVPIDCHDPRTPYVWLEQMVCILDTKEHESLVVSLAKPSEIHAAMLLIGLEAGRPGSYRWDGERIVPIAPEGDGVEVVFVHEEEGREVVSNPTDWVVDTSLERTLSKQVGDRPAFVFSGSRFVSYNGPEVYDADFSGTLIGLATFGGETIAFCEVISHEAMYQEPEWLANCERVPEYGTGVRVRISAAE